MQRTASTAKKAASSVTKRKPKEAHLQEAEQIIKQIAPKLGITKNEDWYQYTYKDVLEAATKAGVQMKFVNCLQRFSSSLSRALEAVIRDYKWDPLRFKIAPRKQLTSQAAQRNIFDRLFKELHLQTPQDWYNVSNEQLVDAATRLGIAKSFGSMLKRYFGLSVATAITTLYPEHQLDLLKFKMNKRNLLMDPEVQRKIFDGIGKQLGVKSLDDWYNFKPQEVLDAAEKLGWKKSYTSLLTNYYKTSVPIGLSKIYPEHEWDFRRFPIIPKNYLAQPDVQLAMLKQIEEVLNITSPEQWYKFSHRDALRAADSLGFLRAFRSVMYNYYNSSLIKMLSNLRPGFQFQPLLMRKLPQGTATNETMMRNAVALIENKLQIKQLEDWYRVSNKQLSIFSKINLFQLNGGLATILPKLYPSYKWDLHRLSTSTVAKRAQQRLLHVYIKFLLGADSPGSKIEVTENAYLQLKSRDTNEPLELDVYVPSYNLAFEYNGEQHYKDVGPFGSFREYQQMDIQKKETCEKEGITLIVVPYTWDSKMESIAATIATVRPDVPLPGIEQHQVRNAQPISQNF